MTTRTTAMCLLTVVLGLLATRAAQAVPIFSQTPPSNVTAFGSDVDIAPDGNRYADEFTLPGAATARSVTWRGAYSLGNTPVFPTSFDLTIYADAAGAPGAVLSNTPVSVTGIDTGVNQGFIDVYEFQADLTATPLSASTTYWFSPLADTSGDADDGWTWTTANTSDAAAIQINVTGAGPWLPTPAGPFYFILDDEPLTGGPGLIVPEPASVALILSAAPLLLTRGRRRRPSGS